MPYTDEAMGQQEHERSMSEIGANTKVVPIGGAFAKGHQKLGGRQKGASNKVTAQLKDMVLQALDEWRRRISQTAGRR
jgi:hypothetical protein